MSLQKFTATTQPDYDEAVDPDYDEGTDPDYDDIVQPSYDTDFADPDAQEASQEWYARKQK